MAESLKERIARKKAEALLVAQSSYTETKTEPTVEPDAIQGMVDSLTEAVKLQEKEEAKPKKELSIDDMLDAPLGITNSFIAEEAAIVTADIVPRIRQLNSLSDAQLESEMKLLKAALMANPEAVALMLPEDVGEMVIALRRITREAVIAAEAKASGKTKAPKSKTVNGQMEIADDF